MSNDAKDDAKDAPTDQDGRTGQVSQVQDLDPDEADTPISDSQSVAGNPTDESSPADGDDEPNVRAGSYRR